MNVKDTGWIKIHRNLLQWEWYDDLNVRVLFLHLLLTVNYEDKKWRGLSIKKGSRITGREQLSSETGISVRNVRTAIKKLEMTKELTIKKDPKGSMFTVVNWSKYQSSDQQNDHHTDQTPTSERPATDQQVTTTKETKEYKEDNSIMPKPSVSDKIDFSKLLEFFNKTTGKKSRVVNKKTKEQFKARLKEGYTKQDIKEAIMNCYTDSFHKETNHKHLTLEFIGRADKLDKYSQRENIGKNVATTGRFAGLPVGHKDGTRFIDYISDEGQAVWKNTKDML